MMNLEHLQNEEEIEAKKPLPSNEIGKLLILTILFCMLRGNRENVKCENVKCENAKNSLRKCNNAMVQKLNDQVFLRLTSPNAPSPQFSPSRYFEMDT